MSTLYENYKSTVRPALKDKFQYKNVHQVPKLERVIINSVTRDAVQNAKVATALQDQLTAIAGQRALVSRAKKSVASFKLREGMPLGATVTLRGKQMYDFCYRLFNVSLPRVRDFRGTNPKGFDGRGNYTLGIKEHIIFPEINYDKIDKIRGLGITFVTTAKNNDEARELLGQLGMPFKKQGN